MKRRWLSKAVSSRSSISSKVSSELVEFVVRAAQSDPRREVAFRRGSGRGGDSVQRAQYAPGDDPAQDRGEGNNEGERDQRVLQEMREGEVTLMPRALELEVRVALGKQAEVGMVAQFFRSAPSEEAGRSLLTLPLRLQACDQDVADCDDDRSTHGEQAGVKQCQLSADGQPRAVAQIR